MHATRILTSDTLVLGVGAATGKTDQAQQAPSALMTLSLIQSDAERVISAFWRPSLGHKNIGHRRRRRDIWRRINLRNLHDNIAPTRARASLVLTKGADHSIQEVALRKL